MTKCWLIQLGLAGARRCRHRAAGIRRRTRRRRRIARQQVAGPRAHIFVIMLENHSQSSVIGDANAPYINSLAQQYATPRTTSA